MTRATAGSDPSSSPSASARSATTGVRLRGFYGWRIVGFSCIALAATAPGQTAAVSAFIDPMMADLGLSRSGVSTAYLVGTLGGAAAMPTVGSLLDRFGVRRTMALIGAVFGAVLIALAAVSEIVGLTAGFVGIRLAGQGALGLTATTATALWFSRRRGLAVGLVASIGSAGISLAPIGLERLIAAYGWQTAWVVEGVAVWAIVIPLALFGMRDRPEVIGQLPDGLPSAAGSTGPAWGLTRREAVRSPFFWVVAGGVAATGMLVTAVAFHQISLLGERGLSPTSAAANFIPQTVAALAATLGTGVMIDRLKPRWVTAGSMLALSIGLAWGAFVSPGWSAIAFGAAIGAAGGSIRSVEAATFPRYFGVLHIGSIRGMVSAIGVGSSALGPVLFATVYDTTGSYTPALLGTAPLPLLVALAALIVAPPGRRRAQ